VIKISDVTKHWRQQFDIWDMDFSIWVGGFWVENAGTADEIHVSEDSIFVVGEMPDDLFLLRMIDLGRKYDQDGVLVKTRDGTKIYDQRGDIIADIGTLKPNKIADAYSKLRNSDNTFVFEDVRDDMGWIMRLAGINER